MEKRPTRRRVDVDTELYRRLETHARQLFISPNALAALLLKEGLDKRSSQMELIPTADLTTRP